MPCINSLEPGLLRRKRGEDYEGILGGSTWVHAFGLPVLLAACLQLLLACSSKIHQAPVGASAPAGQHLGAPPAPQPPTVPSPSCRLCVSETSLQVSLALPEEPLLVIGEDGLGQLPPLLEPLGGRTGQHSTSGAAARARPGLLSKHQRVVGGRRERVGMGTRGKRDRDGRDL